MAWGLTWVLESNLSHALAANSPLPQASTLHLPSETNSFESSLSILCCTWKGNPAHCIHLIVPMITWPFLAHTTHPCLDSGMTNLAVHKLDP